MPDIQEQRAEHYARTLSRMLQKETISDFGMTDVGKFREFHELLHELFPHIFAACELEDFNGSILMRWRGSGCGEPVMLMNHHDVVEGTGQWKYPPFSGTVADGRVWGRGARDTKGGLFAMLQAADELAAEGFIPARDVYFESACTEECDGSGADAISRELERRGVRFFMTLDEGGMIVYEPVGGVKGRFAMVGTGEKGCADLKFIARSGGGHASAPGKDTPLVRLGKFMAACDDSDIFTAQVSPTLCEMFDRFSDCMSGALKTVFRRAKLFRGLLGKVMPKVSPVAGAMLKTTLAFTMAGGSEGTNVLPQEAYIIGNMRFSHHQGGEASIAAVTKLAKKYGVEVEVLDPGFESPVSSYESEAFRLVEKAIDATFDDVRTTPYIMTGASDSRYMSRVCDNCLRFAPFVISDSQLDSIHGIDENVDISALAPAVDFYRYIIENI